MEITEEQYQQVAHLFPVARGGGKRSNLPVLNAVLYLAEQGCQGQGLPESFGNGPTVYMRWSRWTSNECWLGSLPRGKGWVCCRNRGPSWDWTVPA